MATITYQCSVCKRKIQKLENKQGLTVFSKCIITEGCHGKLYTIDRNIDNIRETFPFSDSTLMDYTPRKAFYKHFQTVSTRNWRIEHNLLTSPVIVIYSENTDGSLTQLNQNEFIINIIDKNTVNVVFTQNYKGIAQCIARSTTLTPNIPTKTTANIKITSNGILTLSIPEILVFAPPTPDVVMDNLPFNVIISIEKPSTPKITYSEVISTTIDSNISWADWHKILLRKRKNYIVRTKNILTFAGFQPLLSGKSTLPNGTLIRFEKIQFPNSGIDIIESRKLLVLLSNSPYAPIDKIKNKIIDVGEMIGTNIDYFTYIDGELYVDSSVIENTYPDIQKVS